MGGRVCGQAQGLAAIHLREEPDALMSARPGPSGGYPVRGIPTGSNSYAADAPAVTSARESARIHPLPCFQQFCEGRTLRNAFRQLASFNKLGQDVIVMCDSIKVRTL